MGAVGAGTVVATFFNFKPALVGAAMAGVWDRTTPAAVLEARTEAAGAALRRMLGPAAGGDDVRTAAALARRAALRACERTEGRPLFGGHADLPWPEEPLETLWHAQTLLREFRGDGHIALLVEHGISGIEALVLHEATAELPTALLKETRGWTDEEWAGAAERLRERGWLRPTGTAEHLALSDAGSGVRTAIEEATDRLAVHAYEAIGEEGCGTLRGLVRPLSRTVVAATGPGASDSPAGRGPGGRPATHAAGRRRGPLRSPRGISIVGAWLRNPPRVACRPGSTTPSSARWPSRSVPTPSGTTGRAPGTPTSWSSTSSPPAPDPTSSMSGSGRASWPDSSPPTAAGSRGSIRTPAWSRSPGGAGSRSTSRFEEWEPAGRRFDCVVAGQTWHWVDPVAGAAKAADALRGEGRLAVFWNAFEPPSDLARAFEEVYRRVLPDSPFGRAADPGSGAYEALCDRAADGMTAVGGFRDAERWRFEWSHTYTREAWLDQVPTNGGMHALPADTLAALLDGIGRAVDAAGGSFMMRYTTDVVIAARGGRGDHQPGSG